MKKFPLIALAGLAMSLTLPCCGAKAGVTSISIQALQEASVEVGTDVTLKANVVTTGGADSSVTWAVSNEDYATIDENGKLTAKQTGRVTVSATSVADKTKVAYMDVLLSFEKDVFENYGLKFGVDMPTAAIKSFIGRGDYELFIPGAAVLNNGFWYGQGDGLYIMIFNIGVMNPDHYDLGVQLTNELRNSENLYTFNGYSEFYMQTLECYMDSSETYFIANHTFTYAQKDYYFGIEFYKTDDYYIGPEVTQNEDWTEEDVENMSKVLGDNVIPFMKFGKEYVTGYDMDNELFILGDMSKDFRITENYKQLLITEGYKYYKTENAYGKTLDSGDVLLINVSFTSLGNTVQAYIGNITSEFPTNFIDNVCTNIVKSENTLPGFTLSCENPQFTAYLNSSYKDFNEKEGYLRAEIITFAEFDAYIQTLKDAGFTSSEERTIKIDDVDKLIACTMSKGQLSADISISGKFDFQTMTTDWSEAYLTMTIYNNGQFERPTVYLMEKSITVREGSSYELDCVVAHLDESKLTFTSTDTDVATVDSKGVITPVAYGECKIVASILEDETKYFSECEVTVIHDTVTSKIMMNSMFTTTGAITEGEDSFGNKWTFDNGTNESASPEFDVSTGLVTVHSGNTITIEAPETYQLSEFVFAGGKQIAGDHLENEDGFFVKDFWFIYSISDIVTFVAIDDFSFSTSYVITDGSDYYGNLFEHSDAWDLAQEVFETEDMYGNEPSFVGERGSGNFVISYDSWCSTSDELTEDDLLDIVFFAFFDIPMGFQIAGEPYIDESGNAVMENSTLDALITCVISTTIIDDEYYVVFTIEGFESANIPE